MNIFPVKFSVRTELAEGRTEPSNVLILALIKFISYRIR